MFKYEISDLTFSDGKSFHPPPLTVVVGPNSSGKTRFLRDILSITTDDGNERAVISGLITTTPRDYEEFAETYKKSPHEEGNNQFYVRSLSSDFSSNRHLHVGAAWKSNFDDAMKDHRAQAVLASWFGSTLASYLSTETRLTLTKETDTRRPHEITSILQALYEEDRNIELSLCTALQQAFGVDVRLDVSDLVRLRLRVGEDLSGTPADPREAKAYFSDKEILDKQGDGLRSFVATALSLLIGNKPLLLIDEPESFLHPPQAFRLGELLASHARAGRQIFVTTHSSELLRGILSKKQDIALVRLTRNEDGDSHVNFLDRETVREIANDPLLASTRVLDGLFYQAPIIVEADSDATFYQKVARVIDGADRFHFVHAHNKQTLAKVASPYAKLNIRHAAIADIDALRIRSEFKALIKAFIDNKEQLDHAVYLRDAIAEHVSKMKPNREFADILNDLEELTRKARSEVDVEKAYDRLFRDLSGIREQRTYWRTLKEKGATALPPESEKYWKELSELCASFGLFIVHVGELEGWLVHHGLPYSRNKSNWITAALILLGTLTPNQALDPWAFMEGVFAFLDPPARAPTLEPPPEGGNRPQ